MQSEEYKYLKLEYAAGRDYDLNKSGSFTIDADGVTVFTSDEIKKTTPIKKAIDIPFDNCSLLQIKYTHNANYSNPCIISNAMLYN